MRANNINRRCYLYPQVHFATEKAAPRNGKQKQKSGPLRLALSVTCLITCDPGRVPAVCGLRGLLGNMGGDGEPCWTRSCPRDSGPS